MAIDMRSVSAAELSVLETNKVLKNTYLLLSATLGFSALLRPQKGHKTPKQERVSLLSKCISRLLLSLRIKLSLWSTFLWNRLCIWIVLERIQDQPLFALSFLTSLLRSDLPPKPLQTFTDFSRSAEETFASKKSISISARFEWSLSSSFNKPSWMRLIRSINLIKSWSIV